MWMGVLGWVTDGVRAGLKTYCAIRLQRQNLRSNAHLPLSKLRFGPRFFLALKSLMTVLRPAQNDQVDGALEVDDSF